MIEQEPPFEHRVPFDAADALALAIYASQPGTGQDPSITEWGIARAWDILTQHDSYFSVQPTRPQVARLLVRASQNALQELKEAWVRKCDIGVKAAYALINKTVEPPYLKLVRPPLLSDWPSDIWKYAESYYYELEAA